MVKKFSIPVQKIPISILQTQKTMTRKEKVEESIRENTLRRDGQTLKIHVPKT